MYSKYSNFLLYSFYKLLYKSLIHYPTSINFNYLGNLGFMSGLLLAVQLVSGFILTLYYVPLASEAFNCVQYIMRDINYGWLVRYIHLNGASFFFIAVYLHIGKGIYYGGYKYPRINVWYIGVIIYILMMASAFLGYVLPWGQMSFWAAVVITNFLSVIPFIGESFVYWIWGGFTVNYATLNRFFSLHYLLPFVILMLVVFHLYLLHKPTSSNALGINTKITINMLPYFIVKDFFGLLVYFAFLMFFVCFIPEYLNHSDNYIEANPMVTPPHIVPEWYFLPYYGILKTILNKMFGVIIMFLSILVFLLLPFVDSSYIKGSVFKTTNQYLFWFFCFNFVFLGLIGLKVAVFPWLQLGTICTHLHFFYFFTIFLLNFNNRYFI